ncbi:putative DNA-binding protein [Bacillus fonticola]|uniref:putative DNA-binding protein n=1 Tax=Bacillus fonticola TaxID=2728853 RepID=UPI0014726C8A|nr:putative DNA-binding protein [Bacillus fonticola]
MIDKTTRMNYLYDFYHVLLTEKQQKYMGLYYLDDFSLGEIAEQYEVSRQAVYDHVKRSEAMFEDYEERLGLVQKYQQRNELLKQLKKATEVEPIDKQTVQSYLQQIEDLE